MTRVSNYVSSIQLSRETSETTLEATLTVYDPDTPSHADYWWVLFDGTDTPTQHAALLAEQTVDGSYTGFWTYRPSLVEEIRAVVDSLDVVQIAGS